MSKEKKEMYVQPQRLELDTHQMFVLVWGSLLRTTQRADSTSLTLRWAFCHCDDYLSKAMLLAAEN